MIVRAGLGHLDAVDRAPREPDAERSAAAGSLFDPRAAVVQLGEPPNERQADAGSSGGAGSLTVGLEDALAVLRWDARSVVLDDEEDTLVLALDPDPEPGIARRVLGGVAQQVLDDPFDHGGVGTNRRRRDIEGQSTFHDELGVGDELTIPSSFRAFCPIR